MWIRTESGQQVQFNAAQIIRARRHAAPTYEADDKSNVEALMSNGGIAVLHTYTTESEARAACDRIGRYLESEPIDAVLIWAGGA